MIEEVEGEEENNLTNSNSVASQDHKKEENQEDEEEKDFDFEVPDKLKVTDRDGTTMKKKKNEVVDVLA